MEADETGENRRSTEETSDRSGPGMEGADPRKALLTAIENLDPLWEPARDATHRVVAALDRQPAASLEDLDELTECSVDARQLAESAAELLGRQVPATRTGLTEAAGAVRRDLAAEDISWLRGLTRVEGPDGVSEALVTVRALAQRALDDPAGLGRQVMSGLAALHRLILLGADRRRGHHIEYTEISATDATARNGLTPETRDAVIATTFGDLRLPEHDTGVVDPGTAEAVGASGDDAEVDLSDLDALLQAGTGANLAKLTGPEPRPSPIQPPTQRPGTTAPKKGTPAEDRRTAGVPNTETPRTPKCRAVPRSRRPRRSRPPATAPLRSRRRPAHSSRLASRKRRRAPVGRLSAAYAAELHHSTGDLATAFAEEATFFKREQLAEDRAGQLLAWASAVRVAVLSPSAGAAGVLAELTPCVADHPALAEVGHAFADASRAGVVVVPETADVVSALAEAENAAAGCRSHCPSRCRSCSTRPVRSSPGGLAPRSTAPGY